ncbi:MAG: hypothetical protein KGN77_01200 [Xanthomonadaceae bacterium]|nr:hypothetical protein [Xanthomonadaceae bacterium]MDE1963988.1 hypothetical protein [Xanthomonadaceae bacterium]
MRNNKTFLLAALIAASLGVAVPAGQANAATASGQTKFTVALQPVLVLDYYQEIDLTVDSAALTTLAGTSANLAAKQAITATASGTALTADAALKTTAAGLKGVSLTLDNVWSVRSILAKSSTTTVNIGLGASSSGSTATLTASTDNSSTIGLSNPGTTSSVPQGGTGFASPVYGNVTMTMDLSNAKTADTYSGGNIYITATST